MQNIRLNLQKYNIHLQGSKCIFSDRQLINNPYFQTILQSNIQYIDFYYRLKNMQEQQQSPKTGLFFKQYLSFDFAFTKNSKLSWKKKAVFKQYNGGSHRLQPVCYDNYTVRPQVYFVQWEDSQINKNIYIKQEDLEDWYAVELNQLPIQVKITNNCAFLIGARQLIIVPLEKEQQPQQIPLQAGQIVDIKYCFDQNAESGIYVVYFDTKRGYYARTYTKKTTPSYWSRIKPYLQISFSQFTPYQHFQVIIPNILALAFKEQHVFLYDLSSMKEVGLFASLNHIPNDQTFNIKWKISEPTLDYSDIMNVFICRKNVIETFLIQINRKKVKIAVNGQQVQERVQINRIIAGDIIDWNRTNIIKGEFAIETVNYITDFEINRNQLIYSFLEETQTYIPTVFIADLNNSANQISQVLALQDKVYTNFLQSRFKNRGNMSVEQQQIVQSQVNAGKKIIQIIKKNQFQNKNNKSFCKFLSVGSKFWSIRKTSFLTYQAITELQFVIEKQSEIQDHSIFDINTIKSLSEYRLLKIGNKLSNYAFQAQLNHYKEMLYEMKSSTSIQFTSISLENIAEDYISNTLYKKLVGNIVQDYILHFNKYAEFNFRGLQMSQVLQQNIAITKICSFLEDIDFGKQLEKQINQSLFEYYVDSVWNKLVNKGELSVGLVFKKLFENILLDHYIKYSQKLSQQNMFLETIIELLLLQKKNQFVIEYLSVVLKKYLAKLSQMEESVYYHIITQNSSVFLAFLLSHPEKQKLIIIFKILYNKKHYQNFKTNLRKIQHLIPNQLQILLELELNQVPIKSKLNYEHFVQFVQKPLIFGSTYKKPSKDLIVQEMFLYDNEQRYRQNLTIQKCLLDQIKKASLSNFKTLNSNLMDLSQKQLSFDILKRNNQHILEWEENVLQLYTQLFNQKVNLIETATQGELKQISEYLSLILTKIQTSVFCYCKFYEQYYNRQQKFKSHQSSTLEFIKSKILRQQNIMTNFLLQKPLKIYNFVLSQFAAKFIRKHILQTDTIKVVRERNLLSKESFDQLFQLVLRNLFKKEKIKWQDIDILQYLLMKEGEKKFTKLIKKFLPENLQNVISFLQEKKEQGYLYGFINNIKNKEEVTVPRYRNPFAVC